MKTVNHLLFAFFLVLGTGIFAAQAQTPASASAAFKVSGKILDKSNNQPIPYAAAALVNPETNQNVAGAVADFNGNFVISGFAAGKYAVQVSFMGFQNFTSPSFELSADTQTVDLGNLVLDQEAVALQEVIVMGQRDLIEEKVDRTIYNAENDKTLVGGDATDVMRRVPMLSVDLDGNVSMRGSSNILVLINGKQSAIVATNVSEALKQIPAEEIKSIEVITSPSAKYDAEGTGGVINIVTKKNNLQGASMNLNSSVGYRGSNLGLNASLKRGKMGFTLGGFGRAGYNILGFFDNAQYITNSDGNTVKVLQSADTRNKMLFGRYNLGWDYEINKYNFLTTSVSFGVRNMTNKQDGLSTDTYMEEALISSTLSDVVVENLSNNVDVNLNYTKTFEKPMKEFSISSMFSNNNQTNDFINSLYDGTFEDIASRIKNNNLGRNQEFTIQLDNVQPIGSQKGQILEYGAKNILRKANSDFTYFTAQGPDGEFVPVDDVQFSNEFSYNQNVTAAYSSFTTTVFKNYGLKAGLRYEYTSIDADFANSELPAEIPNYGLWVPSANLSRKLKNGNMVKAAYNRRVQRPFLNFLNPNINAANPRQITQGNPMLDPELTDNYELSYSTMVKGSSVNFTGFFRNTTGSIQPVRSVMQDDIIFTTYENVGTEKAYGLSLFSNVNVSGKFSLNGSIDGYYAYLNNGLEDPLYAAQNEGFVISGRLFANYTLPRDWQIQAFGFARGRQVQLQGFAGGFGMYSLNFNKQFDEKRGSIGFGAENFFSPVFRINSELTTPTIMQQSTMGMKNMNFKINFNYRIGKLSTQGPPRRKRSVNNDDIKEGGEGGNNAQGGMGGNN